MSGFYSTTTNCSAIPYSATKLLIPTCKQAQKHMEPVLGPSREDSRWLFTSTGKVCLLLQKALCVPLRKPENLVPSHSKHQNHLTLRSCTGIIWRFILNPLVKPNSLNYGFVNGNMNFFLQGQQSIYIWTHQLFKTLNFSMATPHSLSWLMKSISTRSLQ